MLHMELPKIFAAIVDGYFSNMASALYIGIRFLETNIAESKMVSKTHYEQ